MPRDLKNKPLVEAILEIRWKLQGAKPAPQNDPHYKILLGRLFDRLQKDYPKYEELPSAKIPDEFVGHMVQHRFRVSDKAWPLVQVGPGVFTLNSTDDYRWLDFRQRAIKCVERLFKAHPKPSDLIVTNLILRYIDAVQFDFTKDNAFDYIRDMLKIDIGLPPRLFQDTEVTEVPQNVTFQSAYRCDNPKGIISIRFATSWREFTPCIVWETTMQSTTHDRPQLPNDFQHWLDAAHSITDDWFFKLIEGDLERRFSGE